MKPYYDDGRGIVIYHGDCREVLPTLGAFDLVLTDPPYGVGPHVSTNTRKGRRAKSRVEHQPIFGDDEPFDAAHLLQSGAVVLWGANNFAQDLPSSSCWFVWDRVASGNVTDAELAWVRGLPFKTVRMFRHQWAGVLRASENANRVLHPTQKPVALMSWCLGFFPDAKTVVDPYMGSGPVARACKDAGKRYVGIEIEERYAEIAARRLAQEVLPV